jgi:predicted nucleic-acid-binding protein
MRFTADANILIRAVMRDDARQAASAIQFLKEAELVSIPLSCLCEVVWVLRKVYRLGAQDVHAALQRLLNAANVAVNRRGAEAGLAMLAVGGDFADGLIAEEGRWLGGEIFASFDKQAVALLTRQGQAAMLLS